MSRGPPPGNIPRGSNSSMPIGPAPIDGWISSLRKALASGKQAVVEKLLANNFVFRGFGEKMNKSEFAKFLVEQGRIGMMYETGWQMNSHVDLKYRALFRTVNIKHTFRLLVGLHYDGQRFIMSCANAFKIEDAECIAIGFANDFLNAIESRVSTRSLNMFAPEFQYHVKEGVKFGDEAISNFLATLRAAPRVTILAVQKFPMKTAIIEMEVKILDLADQPIFALLHLKKSFSGKWRLIYGKNRNPNEQLFH